MCSALPGVVFVVSRYGAFGIDIYRLALLQNRVGEAITEKYKHPTYVAEAFADDFFEIILYDEVVHIPKFEWTPNTVFFSVAEAETEAIDAYMRLHSRRTVVERRVWCVSGTHAL